VKLKWIFLMAWRDSRRSRRRLLLFSSSVVLGIAALVAIRSFGESMRIAIQENAKSLIGADLVFSSREKFTDDVANEIQNIGGKQAQEVSFSSMVYFQKTGGTRLVQVRGLEEGFPFYGTLETDPPAAATAFRNQHGALVEESLMTQFEAKIGDTIKLGQTQFPISGILKKVPGETVVFSTIAPRIYVPFADLQKTMLLRDDSLARYRTYVKTPSGVDPEAINKQLADDFREKRVFITTVEERKKDLGRATENLEHYLSLGGLIALLLGSIGVASAVHVHAKEKVTAAAVLRCLGLSSRRTLAIYLIQGLALGIIGAIVGAGLGLIVQSILPAVVADFVPVPMAQQFVWSAVAEAMLAGFTICGAFALLPLLPLRRVPPLAAIRASVEPPKAARDPIQWALALALAAGVLAIAISQSRRWQHGLAFFVGLLAAFLILGAAAKVVIWIARRVVSTRWPYIWRQGTANLFRPNNRTLLLTLSLGLGTFLILTLFLVQGNLVRELLPSGPDKANAALFDIQSDQRNGVVSILQEQNLPVLQEAALVTMRIASVKGISSAKLLRDQKIPRWVLRREYRSTYRDNLVDTETTAGGKWPAPADIEGIIPISVEDEIAKDLKVKLGDEIEFDIQGVPIRTRVAHLRKVDWRRMQPNFFVVFPSGVLEDAPSFRILTTHVPNSEASAKMQRAVVQKFPNVSAIDMTLVLQTVESVVAKISLVIRFMALFTVFTGLTVLAAAILTGRYQRVREAVLLRTIGASRRQVGQILLVEYFLLGLVASGTAVLLATSSTWALAHFLFEAPYHFAMIPTISSIVIVCAVTMLMGFLGTRGLLSKPPLEVLRQES
jgi:putative ABC transport system permease protein